jgi:2-phosphosulfolactate phosphatase
VATTHLQDDDDLVCAAYIRDILPGANAIRLEDIARRIKDSRSAQKFFNAVMPAFNEKDIAFCAREVTCYFVMRVDRSQALPRVVKPPVRTVGRNTKAHRAGPTAITTGQRAAGGIV